MATAGDTGKIEKKNISDLVTCALCLEYFQNPKLLPCGHSVCWECLQLYIDKTLARGMFLCPLCRSITTLPKDGVDGLTHSFFIVRLQDEYNKLPANGSCDPCNHEGVNSLAKSKCIECCDYLCEECINAHRKTRLSRNHPILPIGKDDDSGGDREEICHITAIKCHKHQDEIVRYFCLPCQMLICRDCKALDHTDHNAVTFQEAVKGKREDLRSDVSELQSKQREISTVVEHISRNISTLGREKKALTKSINEEGEKLMSLINQAADKAITEAEIVMSSGIKTQHNGLEEAQYLLTKMESHISYTNVLLTKGSEIKVLHDYNRVMERSANLTSESVPVPDYQISKLQSTLDSSITNGLQKHFTLSCRDDSPTAVHNASDESVADIKMGRRLETLRLIQTIPAPSGGFNSGVAFHDNTVFACDGNKLYRFNGNTWTDISNSYNTEGRADGVCVNNNTIVVSKGGRGQLMVSDLTKTGHTTVTLPFCSDIPYIVCGRPVDGQPTYLVIEGLANCAVHRIDCKGNILQTYGKGELNDPQGVAVGVHGGVVVTDFSPDDVILFSHDGSVKCRLRQHNNLSEEKMSWTWGVCVDQDGYIYVSSYLTHSVLLFSPTGDYIRTVLTQKDGLYHPTWITVSQPGRLAVCSNPFSCYNIKVYTYIDSA